MEIYNHFEYGKTLAIRLKPIAHTPEKPRFFTAFGLEDLYNFNEKLSSVSGMILIAVDGCESESKRNEADALNNNDMFSSLLYRTLFLIVRKQSTRQQKNAKLSQNKFGTVSCKTPTFQNSLTIPFNLMVLVRLVIISMV